MPSVKELLRKFEGKEEVSQLTATTRIILSFGGRGGGFELTAQLRLDIMDRYGRRKIQRDAQGKFLRFITIDDSFCYLDAVTLQHARGTEMVPVSVDIGGQWRRIDAVKMQNPFWDTFYPAAVGRAKTMVFLISRFWMGSGFCAQELGWFIVDALGKLSRGENPGMLFVVFEEARADFSTLLSNLRRALGMGGDLRKTFPQHGKDQLHGAMVQALETLFPPGANHLATRARAGALIDRMVQAVVPVPAAQDAMLTATDHYNKYGRRIGYTDVGSTPLHEYAHRFEFEYAFDADFRKTFFQKLDAEMLKAGIHPVPGHQ